MKKFALATAVIILMNYTSVLGAETHSDAAVKLSLINQDLSNFRLSPGNPYLELRDKQLHIILGKPNNILGDGFMARTGDIYGITTAFKTGADSVNFLYGNNGQDVLAANFIKTFDAENKLNLETSFFKTKTPFLGIKVSSKLSKSLVFSAETSKNLETQAEGYLVTTKYQDIQQNDKVDFSISYRYVEPAAISDYSANTAFADSKGIKMETNYKLDTNLTFTASEDFARTKKSSKDTARMLLKWGF